MKSIHGIKKFSQFLRNPSFFFKLVIFLLPDILHSSPICVTPKITHFNKRAVYSLLISYNSTCDEGTNVITSHKCNKGHKCNNNWSQTYSCAFNRRVLTGTLQSRIAIIVICIKVKFPFRRSTDVVGAPIRDALLSHFLVGLPGRSSL